MSTAKAPAAPSGRICEKQLPFQDGIKIDTIEIEHSFLSTGI